MTTREVIDSYFKCVNAGKWDDYLDLFDDNVVVDEQLLGHLEGKKALAEGIEGLRGNPDFHNYPRKIVVEGDEAMACWNIQSPMPDGSKLDLKGANYYKVANGKIVYFSNFHDTMPFQALSK